MDQIQIRILLIGVDEEYYDPLFKSFCAVAQNSVVMTYRDNAQASLMTLAEEPVSLIIIPAEGSRGLLNGLHRQDIVLDIPVAILVDPKSTPVSAIQEAVNAGVKRCLRLPFDPIQAKETIEDLMLVPR